MGLGFGLGLGWSWGWGWGCELLGGSEGRWQSARAAGTERSGGGEQRAVTCQQQQPVVRVEGYLSPGPSIRSLGRATGGLAVASMRLGPLPRIRRAPSAVAEAVGRCRRRGRPPCQLA